MTRSALDLRVLVGEDDFVGDVDFLGEYYFTGDVNFLGDSAFLAADDFLVGEIADLTLDCLTGLFLKGLSHFGL